MTETARWSAAPPPFGQDGHAARAAGLRRHNLSLVLRQVLEAPSPISRGEIAARTGLTRATISGLVDWLLEAGMVGELPPSALRRAGRPAVPLSPARGMLAAIGLEVNVHYVAARAVDLSGDVLADEVRVSDVRETAAEEVVDVLAGLAENVVHGLVARGVRVVGAGIALPGLVDRDSGLLRVAPNLGWDDATLDGLVARPPFASLPLVQLGNEANLAAEAEARRHPDPRPSFVYVSGEVGIGGAIVHEGRVYQGRRGWSGELGHVTVESSGPACACGSRGCLEQYAGKNALMTGAGLDPLLGVERLVERLDAGDERARAAVQRAGWALGIALSNVINIVDVEEVVLGGIYAALVAHLAPQVMSEVTVRVLSAPWSRPWVRAVPDARGGARTGAALSVLQAVVADPGAWGGDGAPTAQSAAQSG